MTARPRVLFLSQWFEPEPTYKGLSFVHDLRARGFDVDVLTGFPNFPSGRLFPGYPLRPIRREVMDGVRVTRVPLYPSHDANGARRSLNYLSFFLSATLYLLFRVRRYDAIYVYHPPITVGLAAAVSGLIRRTPFILEVQDLWPDAVAATGMANPRLERPLTAMCGFVYARAARIVAQSRGMAARIAERGARPGLVEQVYNWAEEPDTVPPGTAELDRFGLKDRFSIVYAGNMGPAQALDTALDAAFAAAREVPELRLVMVGSGIDMARLAARAEADGRDIVRVLPGLPRTQIADLLSAADALLVHLADQPLFAVTVPSKTQFYLAMGRPILAGLTGEAAEILTEADAALVVPPQDADALARAMVSLARLPAAERAAMGARGRNYYRNTMSLASGMDAIARVIRAVATP